MLCRVLAVVGFLFAFYVVTREEPYEDEPPPYEVVSEDSRPLIGLLLLLVLMIVCSHFFPITEADVAQNIFNLGQALLKSANEVNRLQALNNHNLAALLNATYA